MSFSWDYKLEPPDGDDDGLDGLDPAENQYEIDEMIASQQATNDAVEARELWAAQTGLLPRDRTPWYLQYPWRESFLCPDGTSSMGIPS